MAEEHSQRARCCEQPRASETVDLARLRADLDVHVDQSIEPRTSAD